MDSVYVEPPLFSKITALLVDDDKILSDLVIRILSRTGCSIEYAKSGDEAIKKFSPNKYAFILMDISMPGMDGHETTRKIREMEAGSGTRVPIIALTAMCMSSDRNKALASGMDDYVSKPFKKEELIMKVAKILGGKIAENFNKT